MAITRKGLIDLKKEVEQELLNAKQIWINIFTRKYIASAPLPGRSDFSTGYYVNQTQIKLGNRLYTFGLNKKNKTKRSSKFKQKRSGSDSTPISIRVDFPVNRPYDKISITNYVHYNEPIEYWGWKKTVAYRPFTKATKSAGNAIRNYLNDRSKNIDKHSKIKDPNNVTGLGKFNQD